MKSKALGASDGVLCIASEIEKVVVKGRKMARTHGHGNPKWTRDETILALSLYFECGRTIPSSDDARVKDLSVLLRSLPYHALASKRESFRNPDGVAFKLQNLRQVATGKGLGNVSATDRQVWTEFGSRPQKVKAAAELIRQGLRLSQTQGDAPDDDDEEEFTEGRVLTEVHKKRERDRRIRKKLISARRKSGRLCCEMCQRPSTAADAALEDATFEAHHIVPVARAMERKTRLSDMALLCANCHRLLHRSISLSKRWLDIGQGRDYLAMDR